MRPSAAGRVLAKEVLVVGQGYVGLPLAMRAVSVGHVVTGMDTDRSRIRGLREGRSHVEDVADAEISAALGTGRFHPVSDPADLSPFDVAVITVPTPLTDGAPDLSYIEAAAEMVGPLVQPGCTVVLESTTYPGTTEEILAPKLSARSALKAGVDFHVGYSPERIDPGNTRWTFASTPKIVAGVSPDSLAAVDDFYTGLVDRTVPVGSTRVAELAKLLENTYRHVNIALVNELAVHAHALDIDIWEVTRAAATKPFGFAPFSPGPGVGGHCLPIDPSYLSWRIERQLGVTSRFVTTANDINRHMPAYVIQRVQLGLNERAKPVRGSRVLILGLAYKGNSRDARETPADAVIRTLVELGAEVVVHDTHVGAHELDLVAPRVPLTASIVSSCDVAILLADHDDVEYEVVVRHAAYIFDTRHRLRGDQVESL